MAPHEHVSRPEWWAWDLAFTPHVGARMEERGFSEVELRTMLEDATGVEPARRPGRFLVRTRRSGDRWMIVVEPDAEDHLLLIVTAYPREDRP